jgi:hypothetical protein
MLVCSRCHRTNPVDAAFCHFDGAELRPVHDGSTWARQTRLPHEFVFPSGRRCRTYEDLVEGCQEEWEAARSLFQEGVFRQFLTSAGRLDLARTAQQSHQSQTDLDLALDAFLRTLPTTVTQAPRLDLSPRRLVLGTLRAGETRQVHLLVSNEGKGLLHGSLTIAQGSAWLLLGDGTSRCECRLKTAREQQLSLRIDTRGLPAGQSYSAKITVITNGGIVEVPVRFDLQAQPFLPAPFQGVSSPREMAERMREQPKEAVPLLESGAIGQWFTANGWTYPVQGTTAKGVAAVQQFFEVMGVSKPPSVELAESELSFTCMPGDTVYGQATLRTTAKKWIYAQVDSDMPWLRVTTPQVSGPQQTGLTFEVNCRLLEVERNHEGKLHIVANGGQTLTLPVRVNLRRPYEVPSRRRFRPLLVGALAGLLCRLLLAGPADLYARVLAASPAPRVAAGSFASWLESPLAQGAFVKHFVLASWWLGALVGGVLIWKRASRKTDLLFGLIAGAVASVAGSATLACLMPVGDYLPRALWQQLARIPAGTGGPGAVWWWTAVWITTAVASWTLLGAGAGLALSGAGRPGTALLARASDILSRILQRCGLKRAARYFALP